MKQVLSFAIAMALLFSFALAEGNGWSCPNCGKTVEAGHRFCPYCGYENEIPEPTPVPEDWFCTKCMQYVDASFTFCWDCGGTRETTGLRDGEWFCGNCQKVNKGGFCGKCGKSREEAAVKPPKPTPTPEPTPTPKTMPVPEHVQELQAIRDAEAGEYVTYGHYPQTAEGNDDTPIEWLVLDVQGDRALLLSRYGLDAKRYNTERGSVTWETCSLRKWLNGEFLETAFSESERGAIPVSDVVNSYRNQGYSAGSASGGNDTEDRVFLLSFIEAREYLGVVGSANERARAALTAYAMKNGALSDSENRTSDGAEAGWWWLRTPGYSQEDAALVFPAGSLWFSHVDEDGGTVRPALWIDTGSISDKGRERAREEGVLPGPEKLSVGSYVSFGTYPQTAEGNDDTPIEWLVLDVQGDRALLLSRYGLDEKPFHSDHENVYWENCDLREWLNGAFMDRAFSREEQRIIPTVHVDNSARQSHGYVDWNSSGGNDTDDKVFLLSYAEAYAYLGVTDYDMDEEKNNNVKARSAPTAYAAGKGTYVSSDKTVDGEPAGNWWLRTPGSNPGKSMMFVGYDGSMWNYGVGSLMVRPALWVDLQAGN